MANETSTQGITRLGGPVAGAEEILTTGAVAFVADLVRTFRPRVMELLRRRREVQARFDAGALPDFLPETREVREGAWTVAPLPADLLDRRVEITGPVDRKMVINALNSGANVFMADFEDATAPTLESAIDGQRNLRDAVLGTISHHDPVRDRHYALGPKTARLFVRPRGWHLPERHLLVDGEPAPGALFDFGLYLFHNAAALLARGKAPCFYLPKMQSHLEARLWNDVFLHAQASLGIAAGTIRATCLIETLPAAFEMHEILWELRQHSAGLNCGRWDYIFSFIKTRRTDASALLPDRAQVTMTQPCMKAYSEALIQTCHRRGVHAMGGMAAQIPIKRDAAANERAMAGVRADKLREVLAGHDGTWVAHPGLVPLAREVFDAHMPGPNQIERRREDVHVTRADLLAVPTGTRTEAGLRQNVSVGVQYLEAWLGGLGCVPLHDLMEDAATAEISRTQLWQWVHHGARLEDGRRVDAALVRAVLAEELAKLEGQLGPERFGRGHFAAARDLFDRLATAPALEDFLTLPAYDLLVARTARATG